MKNIFISLCLLVSSSTVFAETLLSCSPPWGSSLQEIKITVVNGNYFRTELNSSGALSIPIPMSASSWDRKNLRWESPREGKVHLQLVTIKNEQYWAYEAQNTGFQIKGYCNDN